MAPRTDSGLWVIRFFGGAIRPRIRAAHNVGTLHLSGMRFLLSTTHRCGSTWVSQFLTAASGLAGKYFNGAAVGFRLKNTSEAGAIEALQRHVARHPEIGVWKTHDVPPRDFDRVAEALPGWQIVTVSREFKDVVVSRFFYCRYHWATDPALGELTPHLKNFLESVEGMPDREALGKLVDSQPVKNWAMDWAAFEGSFSTRNAVRLTYEGMLSGADHGKLAKVIRQPVPPVASFAEMQQWEAQTRGVQGAQHFFRKGRSGQWQEWFSEEQACRIDAIRDEALGTSLNSARNSGSRVTRSASTSIPARSRRT